MLSPPRWRSAPVRIGRVIVHELVDWESIESVGRLEMAIAKVGYAMRVLWRVRDEEVWSVMNGHLQTARAFKRRHTKR